MGLSLSLPSPVRQFNRNLVIGGSVVLFHVAALWALQSGLLRRAVEIIVPIAVLSEIVTPPAPKVEQPPEVVQPKPVPPPKQPVTRKVETRKASRPATAGCSVSRPLTAGARGRGAAATCTRCRRAGSPGSRACQSWSSPPATRTTCATPRRSIRPSASDWANRARFWCAFSSARTARPRKPSSNSSSGFERLDRSALEYVMKCRYVPGKVAGVPQAMWHEAPVNFVLE